MHHKCIIVICKHTLLLVLKIDKNEDSRFASLNFVPLCLAYSSIRARCTNLVIRTPGMLGMSASLTHDSSGMTLRIAMCFCRVVMSAYVQTLLYSYNESINHNACVLRSS